MPNLKDPKVSVVIPSYNSHKTIGETLKGVRRQTALKQILEIIVVDSSDDDISHEFLKNQEDELLKVTRSGYRVMPALQRNIGGKMAKGDVICFVDSDAYPANDWLEIILEQYKAGNIAGGGSYRVPDFQRGMAIAYAQYFLEFSEFIGFGKKHYQDRIASCNMYCDKEVFMQVDGFPEVRASEDSLFSLKVNKVVKMVFLPNAAVYHIFRENKKHFLSNQKLLGKYIYLFRRKSYNSFYYKGILPYLFIPAFLSFKLLRIFIRVLRTNPYNYLQFIKAFPLLLRGLIIWGGGFLSGISEYKNEQNNK